MKSEKLRKNKSVNQVVAKAKNDSEVVAVVLFGSRARDEASSASDVDVCLVLRPGKYDALTLSRKRLNYLKQSNADIHIFSQLPLYIRRRVIKEGKILLCHDEDALYEIAFRTVQAFEDFKHIYYGYLEGLVNAGS